MNTTERLSGVDAAWLRMDHPTNLMVISGLIQLGDHVDFADIRVLVEQRLLRYDRFRMRAVRPRLGRPEWRVDPHFDLAKHVIRMTLPRPGNRAALQRLVSELMSSPLDGTRPLWQLHVIEQYEGGTALLFRIHHAIADGFALLGVMLSLTDAQQDEPQPEPRSSYPSLLPVVVGSGGGMLATARQMVREPACAAAVLKLAAAGTAAIARLVAMRSDPRTALKGPLGVSKTAAWSEPIPLARIKEAGKRSGCTVNDVLLASVAGGIRRYLLSIGQEPARELRAVVPVNLRSAPAKRLGNAFGLAFVPLPIGVPVASERLALVHQWTSVMKTSAEPVAAFGVLAALGSVTSSLEATAVRMFGAKATAVITNVPGPREVRLMAGKPIRRIMFWVPQSGRLGLGISLFSYAGEVMLGIAGDTGLIGDADRIVRECMQELGDLGC